jgi:hypothetical protein
MIQPSSKANLSMLALSAINEITNNFAMRPQLPKRGKGKGKKPHRSIGTKVYQRLIIKKARK